MSNTPSLLPCPFCGCKAAASVNKGESLWSHDVVDWTRVHCTNDDCNAQTEATCEGYEPSAIEVWNNRTPGRDDALKLCRAMPTDAELLAHIKEAVPGLTRVNTALMVAKAVLEKFGSRRVASEVTHDAHKLKNRHRWN